MNRTPGSAKDHARLGHVFAFLRQSRRFVDLQAQPVSGTVPKGLVVAGFLDDAAGGAIDIGQFYSRRDVADRRLLCRQHDLPYDPIMPIPSRFFETAFL